MRVEFRCPDPTCNPYFVFSAILLAAIDGIQNKLHPGEPLDRDIYDLPAEEFRKVPRAPQSLEEALLALEADHDFLLQGDVFTPDVLEHSVKHKREEEIAPMRLRPHPYEFSLYYDV
jgi:glutamine synthetase